MLRLRLEFEKTGRAVYISHLDLMRTFQRAFSRANMRVWHTEGFNPRAYLSMAQPLSLGFSGTHELMDVQWEGEDYAALPELLNAALPEGIRVLSCWEAEKKAREISQAAYTVVLSYDGGGAGERLEPLRAFYRQPSLVVMKKTKRGMGEADIRPQIRALTVELLDENRLILTCRLDAGGTVLNPSYLLSALPEDLRPDGAETTRTGLLLADGTQFR